MPDQESSNPIVTVFSSGKRHLLGRSSSHSTSYFGGPGYDQVIKGPRYGPRRLHHVVTLNHSRLGINALKFGFKTSLYYGFCFEGCELEWERTHTAAVQITKIEPRKSTKDFPYFGYPDVLPYFPLEIIGSEEIKPYEIEEQFEETGWDIQPSKIYVVVHSHGDIGVALFDPSSCDCIFFEFDPETGRIRTDT